MYTDFQRALVCGLRRVWNFWPVAMSSVTESDRPPMPLSALMRMALLVPTSIAALYRFAARWISEWNGNCWDSAARVTNVSSFA